MIDFISDKVKRLIKKFSDKIFLTRSTPSLMLASSYVAQYIPINLNFHNVLCLERSERNGYTHEKER